MVAGYEHRSLHVVDGTKSGFGIVVEAGEESPDVLQMSLYLLAPKDVALEQTVAEHGVFFRLFHTVKECTAVFHKEEEDHAARERRFMLACNGVQSAEVVRVDKSFLGEVLARGKA